MAFAAPGPSFLICLTIFSMAGPAVFSKYANCAAGPLYCINIIVIESMYSPPYLAICMFNLLVFSAAFSKVSNCSVTETRLSTLTPANRAFFWSSSNIFGPFLPNMANFGSILPRLDVYSFGVIPSCLALSTMPFIFSADSSAEKPRTLV